MYLESDGASAPSIRAHARMAIKTGKDVEC